MLKRLVFVIVLFVGFSSYGQEINELRKKASNSSDSELIVFIQKAKDQGLSLVDAEKQLVLIGGKAQEIKKLRNLWNKKLPKSNSEDLTISDEIKSQFGETDGFSKDSLDIKDEVEEIKRFGIIPKVALLSHSNFGSDYSDSSNKMSEALKIIKKIDISLEIYG